MFLARVCSQYTSASKVYRIIILYNFLVENMGSIHLRLPATLLRRAHRAHRCITSRGSRWRRRRASLFSRESQRRAEET
jgi:hypothetical protein